MSNCNLKIGKFVATIVALSSISAILSIAEQAEAFPAPTIMPPGSSVRSNNQCFSLNAQADGNLVLYKQSNGQALWNSGTYGRNVKQTIFQSDGNLVIYNTSNQPVWASNTDRRGATQINVQDDGNVVMYNSQNQAIWATNTATSCGNNTPPPPRPANSLINNTTMPPGSSIQSNNQCFSLNAQSDGNFVLYRKSNGQALWNTGTYGRNVKQTIFQTDGNLVIYNTSNQPVWTSNTDRRGGTRITLQDDGNFVMYNAQNQALWTTNTVTSCNPPTPTPPPPATTSHSTSQSNVNNFVNSWLGKTITRGENYYPGQCVTLIARYLQDYYGASKTSLSLDNGGQTATKIPQISNSFSPISDPSDPIPGSIISFPNAKYSGNCNGRLCGHVALVVSSKRNGNNLEVTILDSNWDGKAGSSLVDKRTITIYSPPPNSYATGPTDAYGNGILWVNPKN